MRCFSSWSPAVLGICLLLVRDAHAHGTANVEAKFAVSPADAAAGSDATLEVTFVPLEAGAMDGAVVEAKLSTGGDEQRTTLARADGERYTTTFKLERGNTDLRIYLLRGEKREVAMSGFTAADKLEPIPELNKTLFLNPAGRFDAIPWLDNLSGIVGGFAALIAIVLLWRRRATPDAAGGAEKSPVVLWLAAAAALCMPFGAYWDIAFHMEAGREGLFSPPHRLIYAGILLSLVVIAVSLLRRPPGTTSWRAHFLSDRFAFAAAVAAALQLSSAPFDELWHNLFGLDVSVWSPPHALLIFGGIAVCLCLSGIAVRGTGLPVAAARLLALAGALLVADVFLAESAYEFPSWHVSQQRPELVFVGLELVAAALVSSVAVRVVQHRFAATAAVVVFLALRIAVYPFLASVDIKATPAFPLWLIALPLIGLVIDIAQRRRATKPRR